MDLGGQDSILTRDNMKKHQWQGDTKCSFCEQSESAQHLFFGCPVARVVWRTVGAICLELVMFQNLYGRFIHGYMLFLPGFSDVYTGGVAAICWAIWLARNRATFEKKWINTPFEIVFTTCAFLKYWAGLQKPVMMEVVKKGADMLKENTSQLLLLCGPPLPDSTEQDGDEGG
uniref:Reverse transcriptase zinc-binding domain-containing protein n=1 Tax=Hordeum vulgare subsp. vulgare TaxID=112509 RepID=A0A8I6Z0C5_HORVV